MMQIGAAPAPARRDEAKEKSQLLPGQEITGAEMAAEIIRLRIGTGYVETRHEWHGCLRVEIDPNTGLRFEASGPHVFDVVANLRAKVGNDVCLKMFADEIPKTPYPFNLRGYSRIS